ncbi:MAG: hypothetical protein CMF19_07520 [Idiomarinaceae bacterium]|nr:hypothetical protein [Idiomarinaceae bacterium]
MTKAFRTARFASVPYELMDLMTMRGGKQVICVYLWLHRFGWGSDEGCWASRATIANRTGIKVKDVQTALRWLIQQGWVVKTPRPGRTSVYTVLMQRSGPSAQNVPGAQMGWGPEGTQVPKGPQVPGAQKVPTNKNPVNKNPYINTVGFPPNDACDTGETDRIQPNAGTEQVPKTARKRRTYTDEFNDFWKQYQAIDKKASGQSKPKAAKEYAVALRQAPHSALQDALRAAVNEQSRADRTPGALAATFPDCWRWLRDGKYEAFLENGAAGVEKPFDPRDHAPNGDDPF